jgi:soluble lytic murein transglycosylase-like protein
VLNNPLRYIDPSGHAQDSEVGGGWDEEILHLPPLRRAYDFFEAYKDVAPWAGGKAVLRLKEKIVSVERERGLPPGLLGAVVWHEGSAGHKGLDAHFARQGINTTIGLAEISVETAARIEDRGLMPASESRDQRISTLLDPEQNIKYAGACLQYLHKWVGDRMPQASEKLKWEMAVVAYNVGEGGMQESFARHGWGGLGPRGRRYYSQVVPYIPKIRGQLYGGLEGR